MNTEFEFFDAPEETLWQEILGCKYKRRVAALQLGLMMDLILHRIEILYLA